MKILLNPGPVVLSERVRHALLKPDLCHREQEFIDLQNSIRTALLDSYQLSNTKWASITLTGSGTSAMEAMMSSLVPAHGKVLIIENGVYGERLTRIAMAHHIDHVVLHHAWDEAIDLDRLEDKLCHDGSFSHLAVVQHETTTGRLNNIDAVAKLCSQYGNVPILLDAVSSFGAEEIKFRQWNLVACAATANKCLHGVPGVSFVIVNRKAVEQVSAIPARTLYLDLVNYLNGQDNNDTPFTPSVQAFHALAEALDEFSEAGGWQQRQRRYWQLIDIVRHGLAALNIKPFLKKEDCSCVLNAFHLPVGISYQELHDKLKAAGYIIYAGQSHFAKSLFRIACMGEIKESHMQGFVKELSKITDH